MAEYRKRRKSRDTMTQDKASQTRMVFASRLPAPYREPLLDVVSKQPGIDLQVLYQLAGRDGTAWKAGQTGLEARFSYRCLTCHRHLLSGWRRIWQGIYSFVWGWRNLSRTDPHVVILHGYSFSLVWAAWAWARWRRKPYALRSDSNGRLPLPPGLRGRLKRWLVGTLTQRATGVLCIGTANREYWRMFGARPEQEFDACYAVDQSLFCYTGDAERAAFRRRHDIDGRFAVLFVGRLIERKRLPLLLDAFAAAARERPGLSLIVAGDGAERSDFQAWKREHPDLHVVDLGGVRYNDMPALYSACDVLACPYEREPWGLTLNEAMSCALPVIASTSGTVGAAIDLVRDGVTGIALRELNPRAMRDAILRMARDDAAVKRMRANTVGLVQNWTYERAARGFVQLAVRASSPKGTNS